MTWFGIVLVILYVLNAGINLGYIATDNDYFMSKGWLLFSTFISIPLLVCGVLFIGTGHI